jgi:hypothetical protein
MRTSLPPPTRCALHIGKSRLASFMSATAFGNCRCIEGIGSMTAMFGFPEPAALRRHNETVALAEGRRQADYGAAAQEYGGEPSKYFAYEAAMRAADFAYKQRIEASAEANDLSVLAGECAFPE